VTEEREPWKVSDKAAAYYASFPPQFDAPEPPPAPKFARRGADQAFFDVQRFYDTRREPAARFFRPDGSYPRKEDKP